MRTQFYPKDNSIQKYEVSLIFRGSAREFEQNNRENAWFRWFQKSFKEIEFDSNNHNLYVIDVSLQPWGKSW